jgi:hypothetical protein
LPLRDVVGIRDDNGTNMLDLATSNLYPRKKNPPFGKPFSIMGRGFTPNPNPLG